MAAGMFAISGVALPQNAEAFDIGDAIRAGATAAQGAIQRNKIKKQLEYLDNTEEGRQELFAAFKKEYGVNGDAVMNNRVDNIMKNLTAAVASVDSSIKEKPYLYFVNNQTSVNAFCGYGHVMSINTGLMELFPNDDEVAVVVGHEMGHGQKNHVATGTMKALDRAIGTAVVVDAAGGSALGNVVGNIVLKQTNAHGTKAQEKEADNLAFEYITHSNYNPGACAAVWQRFLDTSGNNAQNALGSIFAPSDHPNNEARRDTYVKLLEKYGNGKVTAKDGIVYVNGKEFATIAAYGSMSQAERSYFVFGNLAAAYHNGHDKKAAAVKNGTVMLGAQPIITPTVGDESAETLAARLNEIK